MNTSSTTPEDEDWTCTECDGTGMLMPNCPKCAGDGWVDDPSDGGTMVCPECGGDKCETCDGTGEKPDD
jgi:hypothetical protein